MNHAASSLKGSIDWKDLYLAALFEHDKNRLPERILTAHLAIATRKQELSAGKVEEKRVLDQAAFSLQALAQCFSLGQIVARRESRTR
jgi:DNA-directed RNA polymerase